jgi:hypothetical protein
MQDGRAERVTPQSLPTGRGRKHLATFQYLSVTVPPTRDDGPHESGRAACECSGVRGRGGAQDMDSDSPSGQSRKPDTHQATRFSALRFLLTAIDVCRLYVHRASEASVASKRMRG